MVVGSDCLQRTTAAGVVWQLSVRRGIVSEDGACSTFMVGRLDLQRTAAGCLILLSDSGVVHRRKTAQATTWFASMVVVAVVCVICEVTRARPLRIVSSRLWWRGSLREVRIGWFSLCRMVYGESVALQR